MSEEIVKPPTLTKLDLFILALHRLNPDKTFTTDEILKIIRLVGRQDLELDE